jgi:RNA polymerase sigma-70 factor (ECF subfamily)
MGAVADGGREPAVGRPMAALAMIDSEPAHRAGSSNLVAIVQDDAAFRAWYERTAPRVYAYLLSRCGSQPLAEELLQATFVEVVRRPSTFDGRGDVVPWLIGIARHQLARHFRKRAGEERWWHSQDVREIEPASGGSELQAAQLGADIRGALSALPAAQQAALVFRFLDGLSVRAVAAHLGRSEDATESLIRRARSQFERAYRGDADAV